MDLQIESVEVEAVDAAVMRGRVSARELARNIMPLFAQVLKLVNAGAVPGHGRMVWILSGATCTTC